MFKKILPGVGAVVLALTGLSLTEVEGMPSAIAQQSSAPKLIAQSSVKPIVIAFPNSGQASEARRKADAVARFLSQRIGRPVEAVVSDETAAVEALRANRADVAFLSSRPALKAEQLAKARLYLAEVRPNYSGGHTYKSVLLVRKDSPLKPKGSAKATLGQLRGKRMAFASRTSGSGFIIPTGEFVGRGFVSDPDRYGGFFRQVTYGDGYASAMQALLRGQADVAAVSEYAVAPPYITAAEAKQLRVLYGIPGVPAHGIAIDDDVPANLRNQIINAMLQLNQPQNNQLLRGIGNATKLVKVEHNSHLSKMRRALQRAKIDL